MSIAVVIGVAAVATVGSQAAPSPRLETVTVRDTTNDVAVGRAGRRQPGRGDLDIRSVSLTRGPKQLRIVIETVSPMRPGSYVRLRYTDPDEFDEIFLDAKVGQSGQAFVEVTDDYGDSHTTSAAVTISGRRYTEILAFYPRGSLEPYPRFKWLVTVSEDYPELRTGPARDDVPNQRDVVVNPRYLRFP